MTRLRKPTRVAELSNVIITKEWITIAGDDLW
jgi:hypothetical protein